ncbi:hypothetical protein AgCh_038236 [Apium graveolens]
MYDVDTMSIIEIVSILNECGDIGGHTLFYKLPKTNMEKGLWSLETDADVLEMCEMMPADRVIYVYAMTLKPIVVVDTDGATQDFAPSQDPNIKYVDTSTEPYARTTLDDMLDLEGIFRD